MLCDFGYFQSAVGRIRRWFQNHSIASQEGRGKLLESEDERKVPGNDECGDAEGMVGGSDFADFRRWEVWR